METRLPPAGPGSSPGARPVGTEVVVVGGGPSVCCHRGAGRGLRGGCVKPGLTGEGLLGGAPRRGGELAVCRRAAAGAAFPAAAGLPLALPKSQTESGARLLIKAFRRGGRVGNPSPLLGERESPAALGTPPASSWWEAAPGPGPGPQKPPPPLPRGSAAPPDQPPGTSTFLAPGRGRWGRGCSLFRVNQLQ